MDFKINEKLPLYTYLVIVNEIVSDFFDSEGNYQPHIGKLNAMRLFYNYCVESCHLDDKFSHDIVNADDMAEIIKDDIFIREYNYAIDNGGLQDYSFASAYREAMEIVNVKKTSFGSAVTIIGNMISKIFSEIAPVLENADIETLAQIGKDMKSGVLSPKAIVNALSKSQKDDE